MLILPLKIVDFEKKPVQFALKLGILLVFKSLQEVYKVFKMVASIGVIEVRILMFESIYFSYCISDFDRVCDRLHSLIRACMADALGFNIAIPFKLRPVNLEK